MADLRIKWESPLNLSVVDSIAIYRYEGLTSDCAVLTDQGTLLTESLPASQTEYDDLSMPEMGLVTYGVFSKNVTGLSQCAVAQLQMPPTTSKKPLDLTAVYLDASNSPTNLITRGDPAFTVGPTSIMAALEISPLYGIDGGYYIYPLFASLSESDYLDVQNGGSGSSHTMTYNSVDYYMPDTGGTHAGNSIPASFQINGFNFNYTKIDTGTEVPRLDETEEGPIDLAVTTVSPILNESPTAITATEQSLAPVANQAPTNITAASEPVANQAPTSITATEVVAPVANQAPTAITAAEQASAPYQFYFLLANNPNGSSSGTYRSTGDTYNSKPIYKEISSHFYIVWHDSAVDGSKAGNPNQNLRSGNSTGWVVAGDYTNYDGKGLWQYYNGSAGFYYYMSTSDSTENPWDGNWNGGGSMGAGSQYTAATTVPPVANQTPTSITAAEQP